MGYKRSWLTNLAEAGSVEGSLIGQITMSAEPLSRLLLLRESDGIAKTFSEAHRQVRRQQTEIKGN